MGSQPRPVGPLLALLIGLGAVLGASAAFHWSPTYDEPRHLEMGLRILRHADFSRIDNSKMPVTALNALPALLAAGADPGWRWWLARLPQLGWLAGTALVVFAWARRAHGELAAAWAAGLVALDPNLVAHSSLVTTDAPCTFFVAASCWTWGLALSQPSWRRHALAGLVFGLAQAAKFTCVLLLPVHVLVAAGRCIAARTLRPLRGLPAFVAVAWLALNGAYAFQGTGTRADRIAWRSELFRPLASTAVPLPFPRPWIEGVDQVKADDDAGHGNIYADGRMTPGGQRDWFLRAAGWKFPLPLLLLGLAGLLRRPRAGPASVLPPLLLLAFFSLCFNFQLGIRYLLPVVPFLALWSARLPAGLVAAGVAWTFLSALSWWPWLPSYFNERLVHRVDAWRHLADSNLDWGQARSVRDAWQARHPRGLVDPPVPAPGPVLLSANVLTGVLGDPARMACYRQQLPPTKQLAWCWYPVDHAAQDFTSCFPEVRVPPGGEGSLPPGEHLVVLSFRGDATMEIGGLRRAGHGGSETLLGVVVHAGGPFDVRVRHSGPEAALYLDGRPVEPAPATGP